MSSTPEIVDKEIAVELYKELGEYERHFNRIQALYRSLSSSWLLATFAGIGYLLTNESEMPLDRIFLCGLVCAAGSAGILLLWIIDMKVYHNLLLAVFKRSSDLEHTYKFLPALRGEMKTFSGKKGGVTKRITLGFYLAPSLLLMLVSWSILIPILCDSENPPLAYVVVALVLVTGIFLAWYFIKEFTDLLRKEWR